MDGKEALGQSKDSWHRNIMPTMTHAEDNDNHTPTCQMLPLHGHVNMLHHNVAKTFRFVQRTSSNPASGAHLDPDTLRTASDVVFCKRCPCGAQWQEVLPREGRTLPALESTSREQPHVRDPLSKYAPMVPSSKCKRSA